MVVVVMIVVVFMVVVVVTVVVVMLSALCSCSVVTDKGVMIVFRKLGRIAW